MARADIYNFDKWLKLARQSCYSVKRLTQELQVSQRQLQRYTRQIFGRSPQEWLDEERMLAAALMLKQHRSAKVVAFLLGFRQPSHFSREFKLRYGVSPTAFLFWSDREATRTNEMQLKAGRQAPEPG